MLHEKTMSCVYNHTYPGNTIMNRARAVLLRMKTTGYAFADLLRFESPSTRDLYFVSNGEELTVL